MPARLAATEMTNTGASESNLWGSDALIRASSGSGGEQLGPRVHRSDGCPVGVEGRPGLLRQRVGDDYVDGHQQITLGAVTAGDTLAADAERAPVRCAGGNLQPDRRTAQRRHLDVGAEGRLVER